jgi:hypothetical protein
MKLMPGVTKVKPVPWQPAGAPPAAAGASAPAGAASAAKQ